MIEYKTLEHNTLEDIYQTFVSAFGNYQIKLDLSFEALKNMILRRGLNPHTSIGSLRKKN